MPLLQKAVVAPLPEAVSAAERSDRDRRATFVLIAVVLVLRLLWSAVMEATNDEAYHYLYVVYPDWSFFDHPPMTMWVQRFGLLCFGGWVHPLSLRFGFVLLAAGSTWVLARLTARRYGEGAGLAAALLFNLTGYFAGAGGLVLPDPPLVFFSLLTIAALLHAVIEAPDRLAPWLGVGAAFAGALASKYLAAFLPMGVFLYLVLSPARRYLLLRPGPYLAIAVGMLGFVPALIWNAQHGWASFLFQSRRATVLEVNWIGPFSFVVGPALILFPWVWYRLIARLTAGLSRFRSLPEADRLLICLALVPLIAFLPISLLRPILPHWTLLAFVPLYPLAGAVWAMQRQANPAEWRRKVIVMSATTIGILFFILLQARFGLLSFGVHDPIKEASGWESLGRQLKERGLVGKPKTYLLSNRWHKAGQLAFAIRNESPVVCFEPTDARGFAMWSKPSDWVGWDAYLVSLDGDDEELNHFKWYFESYDETPVAQFRMMRGWMPYRPVKVWHLRRMTRPFPFGNGDPEGRPLE
ncbi:MAG: glycosyltransferase family 39 protein [Gemmataceae bacterium]|nr:glycosyltransferase family 39 protein [Gemmataceae bacterium]